MRIYYEYNYFIVARDKHVNGISKYSIHLLTNVGMTNT